MPAWKPPRSTVDPSLSPSPREVVSSSPERPPMILMTKLPLPDVLLPPSTSTKLPPFTESLSSSTLITAKRLGCHGWTVWSRPTRNSTPKRDTLSSPLTCLTFPRKPLKKTSASARSTWRSSPSSISCSSSNSVSLEVKKMVSITPMSTPTAFTPSLKRCGTLTSNCLRSRTLPSLVPPPSETSTEFMLQEMSTSNLSFSTTHKNTSKKNSITEKKSLCDLSSTEDLDRPSKTFNTPSRLELSR